MIDFRMETFLCVCECMNFTHAASKLGLTQPAVSQQIKFLEKEYGAELFIRDRKKLKLTPAGEILRNASETMLNDDKKLKSRICQSKSDKKILTLGVTMTIGEYAIIPALSKYIKAHDNTDFYIRCGNTKKLLGFLNHGEIDFAVVEGYFSSDHYTKRLFREEKYIAVSSSNHQFKKSIKSIHDLTDERLITREQGSGTRAILERALSVKNMNIDDFKSIIEVENIHAVVSLLLNDCGIAFLYKSAVEQEILSGSLKEIKLKDFNISHEFNFLWNKNSMFEKEYEEIFEELKDKM